MKMVRMKMRSGSGPLQLIGPKESTRPAPAVRSDSACCYHGYLLRFPWIRKVLTGPVQGSEGVCVPPQANRQNPSRKTASSTPTDKVLRKYEQKINLGTAQQHRTRLVPLHHLHHHSDPVTRTGSEGRFYWILMGNPDVLSFMGHEHWLSYASC